MLEDLAGAEFLSEILPAQALPSPPCPYCGGKGKVAAEGWISASRVLRAANWSLINMLCSGSLSVKGSVGTCLSLSPELVFGTGALKLGDASGPCTMAMWDTHVPRQVLKWGRGAPEDQSHLISWVVPLLGAKKDLQKTLNTLQQLQFIHSALPLDVGHFQPQSFFKWMDKTEGGY